MVKLLANLCTILVVFIFVETFCKPIVDHFHPNVFIINGVIVQQETYPFMASLRANGKHFCAGTIINSEWILTAGHCLVRVPPKLIEVVVGSHKLSEGGTYYNTSKSVVSKYYLEAHYFIMNDIGLIKIDGHIEYDEHVQPIKICETAPKENEAATVVGWGIYENDTRNVSNDLRYLDVKIMNIHNCIDDQFPLLVLGNQICTFGIDQKGNCNGDSGGPLIYNGSQYGIISWGVGCGTGSPEVYTNACDYVEWITNVTSSQ